MSKMKKFIEEHKVAVNVVAGVGLVTISGIVGWKSFEKFELPGYLVPGSNMTDTVLKSAYKAYPGHWACGYDITPIDDAYSLSDLGKFGDVLRGYGAAEDTKLTHLLAIGPRIVKE